MKSPGDDHTTQVLSTPYSFNRYSFIPLIDRIYIPHTRTKQYPLGLPGMEDEPQLVLANKIVKNMTAVIKELGKRRRMVSIENPRGSTLWSHPDILEFTNAEVLVLEMLHESIKITKVSESRFNRKASPKSIISGFLDVKPEKST